MIQTAHLADCVRDKMKELTGREVTGGVFGLLNLRTLGLYFSPVNFYYGFDPTDTAVAPARRGLEYSLE